MMRSSRSLWAVLATALLTTVAGADGGFFFEAQAGEGYSADQTAIVVYEPSEGSETLILNTEQSWLDPTRKADYAWVVPVPTLMDREDFDTYSQGVSAFRQLYDLTEPRAEVAGSSGWLCGCGSGFSDRLGGGGSGVHVVDSFEVDTYQINILSAENSRGLDRWLASNGYDFPTRARAALEYYIEKNWYFTAVKVNLPEGNGGGGGSAEPLDPLRMTFATDRLVYPMRISAVSSREGSWPEILLYVLAPYRVEADNYGTRAMAPIQQSFDSLEEFRTFYQNRFQTLLQEMDNHGWVVEYAGWLESASSTYDVLQPLLKEGSRYFLTRLRTELAPSKMDQDVEFTRAPNDRSLQVVTRLVPASQRQARWACLIGFYGLATLHGIRRRNLRSWLRGYLAATLLALIIL